MIEPGTPIVVTTKHRGVFFGRFVEWLDANNGHIALSDVRNCVYWSSSIRGVFGLASDGPDSECKIGPKVDMPCLRDVLSVSRCTPESVKKWELAPWS